MKKIILLLLALAPFQMHATRAFKPQAMGGALVDRDDDGIASLRVSPTAAQTQLTATATSVSRFAMNAVTYASSVAGTSMQYLTLTSRSSVFFDNTTNTAGFLNVVLSNSPTAPTDTATLKISLPFGQTLNLNMANGTLAMGYNFLHWYWTGSSNTAMTLTPTARLTY